MKTQEFIAVLKSYCFAGAAVACAMYAALALRSGTVGDRAVPLAHISVEFVNDIPIDKDIALLEIRAATGRTDLGTALSSVDIAEMLHKILAFGWVRRASVLRGYPNELKVTIEAKDIIAYMWQGGQYKPVDSKGNIIDMNVQYISGLVISGAGANEKAPEMLAMLRREPRIYPHLVGMQHINGLRWNLALYDLESGLVIKLPYDDVEAAIARIRRYDERHDLLKRRLLEIDARDPARILVKPRGGK